MRVTKDDYLNKFAIDLSLEFRSENYDNETNALNLWLANNEENLVDYLAAIGMTEEHECWNEEEFTRALLEQDKHILRYGDVPLKGMRDENNNFIPFVAPKANRILRNAHMIRVGFSRYGGY